MSGGALLFVYSDLVGSIWVNRFDLDRTAGELRSAVYNECLNGLLPAGRSSAQLNIYYVSEGVMYEPEDTFRHRLCHHVDTHCPQKIGLTTELSEVVGEMYRGHVHLIIGFPDLPLVTVPISVWEALSRGAETTIKTDGSSGLSSETQPSEVDSTSIPTPNDGHLHAADHLELLSPSFACFMSYVHVAMHPEDEAFASRASQLIQDRLIGVSADPVRTEAPGLAFAELLQSNREGLHHVDCDGTICVFYRMKEEDFEVSVPLVVCTTDTRSELGEGVHAVGSAIRACVEAWTAEHREIVQGVTCCPFFVLAFSGSSLRVYGSVLTDKWIYQELTPPHNTTAIGDTNDSQRVKTLTCLLSALRDAMSHLQGWYRSRVFADGYPQFFDRLHPAITSVKDPLDVSDIRIVFDYIRRLEPHDHIFLAFANYERDRLRTYGVKFTPRYCAEAHRLLAAANYAPELIYCGSPYPEFPGYTRMQIVVTEFVHGGLVYWEVAWKSVRDRVRQAVNFLHSHGMVHGDLRGHNILVDRDGNIRIIDFDWAGAEGVARYPADLARDVPWPAGAEPGGLITKAHDEYWLDRLGQSQDSLR